RVRTPRDRLELEAAAADVREDLLRSALRQAVDADAGAPLDAEQLLRARLGDPVDGGDPRQEEAPLDRLGAGGSPLSRPRAAAHRASVRSARPWYALLSRRSHWPLSSRPRRPRPRLPCRHTSTPRTSRPGRPTASRRPRRPPARATSRSRSS